MELPQISPITHREVVHGTSAAEEPHERGENIATSMLSDLEMGCNATQPKCAFASCTPNLDTFGEAIS